MFVLFVMRSYLIEVRGLKPKGEPGKGSGNGRIL